MTPRRRADKLGVDAKEAAMPKPAATPSRAAPGDLLEVVGHHVGESPQLAEILEVLGEPGHEHYRVRWESGRETTIYPGSDAVVRPARRKEP
jgi:Domain of unknown function (DUF1918)